jgi:type III pantothenate kinase
MITLLAVDIGNTNITAGIFKGKRLVGKTKIPTHSYSLYENSFKRLFKKCGLDKEEKRRVIISSVVPIALTRIVMHLNRIAKCRMTILGRDTKVPIKNMYRIKSEVGQDRLMNAFAARELYGAPAVIIDFGTAVTFDIVSAKGEYLGGLIMPGIGMSLKSLYDNTALLPRVELKDAPHIIGKDTVSSMRGGILFGFGAMCDGLVAQYKKLLGGNTKVILTGGNAKLIKKYAKSIQIVDEDITLKGLRLIGENVSA